MKLLAAISTMIVALTTFAVAAPNSEPQARGWCDGSPPGHVLCNGACRDPDDC